MRTLALCVTLGSLAALLPGCPTRDTPSAVCEHLIALREQAATKPAESPRQARMLKCIDSMTAMQAKMAEGEWETFVPCAHESTDVAAFVACSPTMAQASEDGRARREARKEKQTEELRKKVEEARKKRAAAAEGSTPTAPKPADG